MEAYQSEAAAPTDRASALLTLQQSAKSLVDIGGLRGVELQTRNGDPITSVGHLPQLPQLNVPLVDGKEVLYWDGGFVLRTTVAMIAESGDAGKILVDLRVPDGDAAIPGAERLDRTGNMSLCGVNGSQVICFPLGLQPAGKVNIPAMLTGEFASSAVFREGGTLQHEDYSRARHETYLAFTPLGGHSLSLVRHIDKDELLAPIQTQLTLSMGVLVMLAGGAVLLSGRPLRSLKASLESARLVADTEMASRSLAEAEIQLGRRQLQHVADIAPFLIAFLDPNFIFRFANRAHVLWFQRPLDQIIGKPLNTLVDEVMASDYLEAMAAALATGLPQTVLHERSWSADPSSLSLPLWLS
jgi:PAS domain-containing protein